MADPIGAFLQGVAPGVRRGFEELRRWVSGNFAQVVEGSYAPTLTGMAVGTTGTNSATWMFIGRPKVGGMLHLRGTAAFSGSSITFPSTPTVSLPAEWQLPSLNGERIIGSVSFRDAAPGVSYAGIARAPASGTTTFRLNGIDDGGADGTRIFALTTTFPFTWASGDSMRYDLWVPVIPA